MSAYEEPLLPVAGTAECGPPVSCVVTLVHGTWAPDAAWTREGSPFCIQLENELRKRRFARVRFTRCNWPAGDSHEDRRVGSILLHKHLLHLVREFPASANNLHFVVAHSHGGNVALRTIRHSRVLKSEICGLVTLATPFLSLSERRYGLALLPKMLADSLDVIWTFAAINLLAALPIFLIDVVFRWLHFHWFTILSSNLFKYSQWAYRHGFSVVSIASPIIVMLLTAILLASKMPNEETIETYRASGRRMFRRFSSWQPMEELGDLKVFSVSSLPDEAFAVLTGSWWFHRATGWGCRIAAWGAVVLLVAFIGGVSFLPWLGFRAAAPPGIWDWHVFVVEYRKSLPWISGLIGFFLALLWTKLWLWIFGITSPGLEFSRPGDNLLLDVRAQRTLRRPAFTWNLRSRLWNLIRYSRFGLFHSRVYSNPQTIAAVAEWIEQCTHKAAG